MTSDVLVPALSLRAQGSGARVLPVERTLVHHGLPQPLAADGLRHFYRFHKVPGRVVVAASAMT